MSYRTIRFGGVVGAAVLATALFVSTSAAPDRMSGGVVPVQQTVRFDTAALPGGIQMRYAEVGPRDGEPVLMLHGYTDSWRAFLPVFPHMTSAYRLIVPDQRGHGASSAPACCYRMSDFEADAIALLDALAIDRATVVGHSMGSLVAQRLAMHHPERVRGLVLIGSGAHVARAPVLELQSVVDTLSDPVPVEFARAFQEGSVHVMPDRALMDSIIAGSARMPARIWRDVLRGIIDGDPNGNLSGIRAPTLIIAGEHDGFFPPEETQKLGAAVPHADVVMYEETAHSPNWERPERVAADLLTFLRSLPATAGQ